MAKTCQCAVPTVMASVVTSLKPCPGSFGQAQRLWFWRAGNSIASVATLIVESTITGLLAATGDTKILVSPYISTPETEGGEVREWGSGNETMDGIPVTLGRNATKFTCKFVDQLGAVARTLKPLECEDLEVIFVSEHNKFGHRLDGTVVKGFPIEGFSISDRKLGGFDAPDEHMITFYLKNNWSDYFTITDPTANFDPLDKYNS